MNPSGEQVEIAREGHRAVIVEVSGGVRTYEVDGRGLLDGYAADEICTGARGQLLVPWPNRLRDGRYEFDGESFQVPLSEPDKQNAIHGFLRWEPWRVADRAGDRVVMEHLLHPRAGYPFALRTAVEYRVDAGGLTATVTATNVGERRCPYAMGVHPYLRVDEPTADRYWLESPANSHLTSDERAIPIGVAPVEGTPYDFRSARRVGDTAIDTAFTDVPREQDGRAWVRVWNGERDHGVGIWMDEHYPFYMLFTGDTLPDRVERRRSVAVEPMTCAPNGFASGDGLVVLAAGESMVSRWGIAPL